MAILSGRKRFKDYLKTDSGYILTSRYTHADSVEMPNGKTLDENFVELTLAEYEALPDTKLTDGVQYFITDALVEGQSINAIQFRISNGALQYRYDKEVWVDG